MSIERYRWKYLYEYYVYRLVNRPWGRQQTVATAGPPISIYYLYLAFVYDMLNGICSFFILDTQMVKDFVCP